MEMTNLASAIAGLNDLKEEKKRLADLVKENNAAIEEQEKLLIASMLDMAENAGLDDPSSFTVDVNGRRYGLKIKPFYSIRKEARDEAFAMLRTLGLGDLIVERVDDRTLTKVLEESLDEDGNLPEAYVCV